MSFAAASAVAALSAYPSAETEPLTDAGTGQLLIAALLGIAAVVVLISWAK